MSEFVQRGRGKHLLLLHGYLSCKESFWPQIDYFSGQYRVTAVDFPGFGGGMPLPAPWSVGDYADWLKQFMLRHGICFPHVIAHSFGGRVAVKCLAQGDVFDRAVLCGCAGIILARGAGYRLRVGAYRAVRRVAPRFAERHFGSAEYRTLSPLMRESYKSIVNEDLREQARGIRRPVLFIYGEQDRQTPLAAARIYHDCVRGSRLTILPHCGHFAHLDDALAFNLAAEEFFYDV